MGMRAEAARTFYMEFLFSLSSVYHAKRRFAKRGVLPYKTQTRLF